MKIGSKLPSKILSDLLHIHTTEIRVKLDEGLGKLSRDKGAGHISLTTLFAESVPHGIEDPELCEPEVHAGGIDILRETGGTEDNLEYGNPGVVSGSSTQSTRS
jgi:hypothetical protein